VRVRAGERVQRVRARGADRRVTRWEDPFSRPLNKRTVRS
jgi:hypothetical protein